MRYKVRVAAVIGAAFTILVATACGATERDAAASSTVTMAVARTVESFATVAETPTEDPDTEPTSLLHLGTSEASMMEEFYAHTMREEWIETSSGKSVQVSASGGGGDMFDDRGEGRTQSASSRKGRVLT